MGAWTAILDPDGYSPYDGSNGGIAVRCKLSPSSSYLTGGDTIAGSIVGLGTITKVIIGFSGIASGTVETITYGANPVYDSSNANVTAIQIFWTGAGLSGSFAEITSGTDLHLQLFDAVVYGT